MVQVFTLVPVLAFSSWVKKKPLRKIPGPKSHILFGKPDGLFCACRAKRFTSQVGREFGGIFKYYILLGKKPSV